jgi:hypothetical protein
MSERDDRYARPDLPSTTAEFRAAPDASASTAQFKAFAAGHTDVSQPQRPGTWPKQPWAGEQPKSGRRTGVIALAVLVAVAVVVTLLVVFG